MLRRLLTKSLRIARGLGREKQEGCRCDGLGGAARLGRGRQMLYAVFCKQPGPRMLRKALLLSLLLHVLLLAALAHTIRLAPAPQLPFMLELRVESAAPPGQVQSTPGRRPPVAARPAPPRDNLRATPPPAATPRPAPAAVATAAQPQPVPATPAPAVNGSAGAPAPAVAAMSRAVSGAAAAKASLAGAAMPGCLARTTVGSTRVIPGPPRSVKTSGVNASRRPRAPHTLRNAFPVSSAYTSSTSCVPASR